MNDFYRQAEKYLEKYIKLKKALVAIRKRKQRLIDSGIPNEVVGFDYSADIGEGSYISDTYKDCAKYIETCKQEHETLNEMLDIEEAVEQLAIQNRIIIRLWYFDGKTKEEIQGYLDVSSTTTVYERKKKAVKEFAIMFFGSTAIE